MSLPVKVCFYFLYKFYLKLLQFGKNLVSSYHKGT